jgi:hypothetical protein
MFLYSSIKETKRKGKTCPSNSSSFIAFLFHELAGAQIAQPKRKTNIQVTWRQSERR